MKPSLLNSAKKKKIVQLLEKFYGISKLPYLLIQTGKRKYRIYSGSLSKEEINELGKNLHIELIGTRFCKINDEKLRINFDSVNISEIKSQVENVFELDDEQAKKWMNGENIETNVEGGEFLIMKYSEDFLGVGQNRKTFIQNYVPKERRVK